MDETRTTTRMLALADPGDPGSATVREHLHARAVGVGVRGEELVAEVVHWGVLADEMQRRGEVPSVAAYARRFRCSELEAEFRLTMFTNATGASPLDYHALQWRAVERSGGCIDMFDGVALA